MASYSRINSSTLSFSGDTLTNKNTGIYVGVLNQKTHIYEGEYNNAEKTITYSEDNTTYTTNKPNWLELKLSDTIDNNTASELLITLNGNTNAERTCYIKLSQNSADYLKIIQNYTKGIKIWNLCPADISLNNKAIFISFRYNFNSSIMDDGLDSGKYSCTFSLFKHNDSNITIEKNNYVLFKEVTENLYYLPDNYSLKTIFSNSSNLSSRIIFDSSINFSINQLSMYDTNSEDISIKNKSLDYLTRGYDNVVDGGGLYFNKIQYYLSLADTTNSAINIVNYGDAVFDDDSIDSLPTGLTFNSSSYINYNFNGQNYEWLNKSLFDIKNIGIKPINYEYGDIYKYINIIFNTNYFNINRQFKGHKLYLVCIRKENSKASFKIYRSYHTILNSYSKPFIQMVFEIVKITGNNVSKADGWPNEEYNYLTITDSSALNFYKGIFGEPQELNNIETLYTNNNYQENQYSWRLFEDTYNYRQDSSCFVNNVSIYQLYNNIKLLPYTQQSNHKLLDTIPNCSSYITYINDKFSLTQLDGQIGIENPSTFDQEKLTININNNKGAILYWQ